MSEFSYALTDTGFKDDTSFIPKTVTRLIMLKKHLHISVFLGPDGQMDRAGLFALLCAALMLSYANQLVDMRLIIKLKGYFSKMLFQYRILFASSVVL